MATKPPDDLTDDELRLLIARENLKRYGNPLGPETEAPPAAAAVVKRIAPQGRKGKAFDKKWFSITKRCPKCGKTKNVGEEFGVVVRRGVEAAAGWCKQCRSSTNYRALARKNKSAHHAG